MQRILTLLIALSLAACATPEKKISLSSESKHTIKRVALVEIPEQGRYTMNPGRSAGSTALFMFGAIGGAIAGGIEAARLESATTRFTDALASNKPNISSQFIADLEVGLKQKGYEVTRVPAAPQDKEGQKSYFDRIEGLFDAVLVAKVDGGYNADSGKASPHVTAAVSLLSKPGSNKLFAESYLYSTQRFGANVLISPDKKYVLASVDDVYTDITIAAEGMKEGTSKIAERVMQNF
jgi:hypothetical protein